jgi:ketosteroid isomerase-like protein
MNRDDMLRLFETHRDAEAARDFDAILAIFAEDCFLETVALGSRSEGKNATRAAYEGLFTAFPDLSPDDQGKADRTVAQKPRKCSERPAKWAARVLRKTGF